MRAKKSLGQNFLHHKGTLHKIIQSAHLSRDDHIIEVGPGHGVLTKQLATNVKKVTAIELDNELIPELNETFANQSNVEILHQDALTFNPPKTPYKLVANIPYYITSPLINHFLREQPEKKRPQHLTLLVQKEVAEKICAKTGNLSVLALQVQLFGTPKIISKVPPSHFKPAPKVDSAILNITRHDCPIPDRDLPHFFEIIHAGFAHKRKKLIRNLESVISKEKLSTIFKKLDLSENIRAEELSLQTWGNLQKLAK